MSIFSAIFGTKQSSAAHAKNRLENTLAKERAQNELPYLESMKKELMQVVSKYTHFERMTIQTRRHQSVTHVEVDIVL